MQQIEIKITVTDEKGKPSINIECDENTNINAVMAILERAHSTIRQTVDLYMKKNNIFTKEAGKEIYKTLKIKDLKL